jgi:hypothetical protein
LFLLFTIHRPIASRSSHSLFTTHSSPLLLFPFTIHHSLFTASLIRRCRRLAQIVQRGFTSCSSDSPIHPFTYSPVLIPPIHRFTRTYSTHSPIHLLLPHPFTHSPIHPFTDSPALTPPTHLFTNSPALNPQMSADISKSLVSLLAVCRWRNAEIFTDFIREDIAYFSMSRDGRSFV